MTFDRMIDRHTDPTQQDYVVTVTVEHSVTVTAESGEEAIDKAKDAVMDDDLRDAFERLGDDPVCELSWTHDEVDQADLYADYWED